MRILVQWATRERAGWEELDHAGWTSAPKLREPRGRQALGTAKGLALAVCVQGDVFQADHIAIEDDAGAVVVTAWNDGDDWPEGQKHGYRVRYQTLAPDASKNGAINKRATIEVFAQSETRSRALLMGVAARAWSEFVEPGDVATRHGVALSDEDYDAHVAARAPVGWREWIEGLDASEVDSAGRVKPQRQLGRYVVPKGTRTYYHTADPRPNGAIVAMSENALAVAVATPTTQTSGNISNNPELAWCATTPANEPDSAAWPAGEYRYQLDVPSASVDLVFGLVLLGTEQGGFYRFNAALGSALEFIEQDQPAFQLSGLHMASIAAASWTAGSQDDRFGVVVAVERVSGHGNKQMDMQLGESDDFADGPWPAAGPVASDNAAFFGANQ